MEPRILLTLSGGVCLGESHHRGFIDPRRRQLRRGRKPTARKRLSLGLRFLLPRVLPHPTRVPRQEVPPNQPKRRWRPQMTPLHRSGTIRRGRTRNPKLSSSRRADRHLLAPQGSARCGVTPRKIRMQLSFLPSLPRIPLKKEVR